jgi:hypothetical protein
MDTPQVDAKIQPQRNRIHKVFLIVFVVLAVGSVAALMLNRANASRPQLDVRNIGSNPVLLRHRGNEIVVRPGEAGALRFSPGDTLTIFAGETGTSTSKSIQLEKRVPHQGAPASPPRLAAEVNADDEANIAFRYADGT